MRELSTSDRLKELMEKRHITQNDILKLCEPYAKQYRIKLGKSIISQYINGIIEPGQWKLTVLAKGLGVSETWLMGYDVPMVEQDNDNDHDMDEYIEVLRSNPGMRTLFDTCKNATQEDLERAIAVIQALKK